MAISAADRARQSDRISQTREEAEEKETKLLKRKNEQLKRAEQRHQQELAKLNQAYQSQLGKVREDQKETLSEREMDHQESLSTLRKVYTGNLQNKMESQETDKKILIENFENEIGKRKTIAESQKQNLLQKQEIELAKRDESLGEVTVNAREKMKEAIDNTSRRLREAHEKEVKLFKSNNDQTVIQSQIDKSQMRKAFESQKQAAIRQGDFKEAEWKQKYQELYDQVTETQESGQNSQGQLLSHGLKQVKDKYEKKLQKKTEQMEKSNESFQDSVAGRVDGQVRSKDSRIQALSHKLNNQIVNDQRLRSIERNNLQSTYEDKLHNLEGQRDMTKETMLELNKKRIEGMKEKNDHLLRQANQDYRSQIDIERSRFRESEMTSEQMKEYELNRIANRAEDRVGKLQQLTELNAKRLSGYYDDNLDLAREGFEKKIVDQRERNIELQGQNNRMMADRFRKIENTYSKKLEAAASNYEIKLQEMKDRHEREMRRLEGTSKLLLEDKEKGHRTEKDSTEMKYETRISLMQQEHNERLEKVQKKHQEELRDLAFKMNQYNRKA